MDGGGWVCDRSYAVDITMHTCRSWRLYRVCGMRDCIGITGWLGGLQKWAIPGK
jgi:hypothetical protein